ncbi:MAG: MBL fold metallo-hydrolase [Flavobacteriaceae bacterium]
MKITHYLYNSFLIETDNKKIAIDPGGLMFYYFRFTSLIPRTEWADITHVLVTHGDPDHFWHADRILEASGAPLICNGNMFREVGGQQLMLGPRSKGLAFTTAVENSHTLAVDKTLELDGMSVTGLKATHGPLSFKIGPFTKTISPGPKDRIGWGAIGFKIQIEDKTLVNLGDTLLHLDEWRGIKKPDVLMIPIGGRKIPNTMNEEEALEVVKMMKPKWVIPCHYNCPALFSKNYNPADTNWFKAEVEKTGSLCELLGKGQSLKI